MDLAIIMREPLCRILSKVEMRRRRGRREGSGCVHCVEFECVYWLTTEWVWDGVMVVVMIACIYDLVMTCLASPRLAFRNWP